MKPAQAAAMSKPKPVVTPSAACTRSAVAGNAWSGVLVARMIASTSRRLRRRHPQARRAPPRSPMKAAVSCGAAMWRWRMPVRSRIHSSDVSTVRASSSLLTTRSGR